METPRKKRKITSFFAPKAALQPQKETEGSSASLQLHLSPSPLPHSTRAYAHTHLGAEHTRMGIARRTRRWWISAVGNGTTRSSWCSTRAALQRAHWCSRSVARLAKAQHATFVPVSSKAHSALSQESVEAPKGGGRLPPP